MFDKLYFIFYSSVKDGLGHAERASFLLSSSISLYFFSLYFLIVIFLKYSHPDPWIVPGIFIFIGISNGILTSKYFVGTGRYQTIIDKYGSPHDLSKGERILYILIALFLFFFGSVASFIVSCFMLIKYLNSF
jgi:hypothetical protein